ncbi:hypothetical protein Bca52824_015636 [Brassica carinata]|uniref:Uncharacterized protein n=1 Tax=Brassica carinata TaxID=52824 RepID=A0A8X7W5F2_BRACI|nr:hypothetical protein Bca52824_015636 [Brassica carinata]
MPRMFRVWRGEWKKNQRDHWHFVPTPADYGFTMYVEDSSNYEIVEGAIRETYGLGEATPVVVTYGMPDWMLFPSGNTPPLTISNSEDLQTLLTERPWVAEVTLLVTLGAKSVAEYHFLRRSNFSIGSTTYVVDGSQGERAKAIYESLVFGERLPTSERVMNEIFGEQEMLIFYRVALEMGLVDMGVGSQAISGVGQGIEVIRIDDDEDMADVGSSEALTPQTTGAPVGGLNTVSGPEGQLIPINAADAPSVLWDVGLDLLNYPSFHNSGRDPGVDRRETDFWRGLMEEASKSSGNLEGGNEAEKLPGGEGVGEGEGDDGEANSCTGSPAIICSQYPDGGSSQVREIGEVNSIVSGSQETEGTPAMTEGCFGKLGVANVQGKKTVPNIYAETTTPSATFPLTQSPGSADPKEAAGKIKSETVVETSSEGSHTEGG